MTSFSALLVALLVTVTVPNSAFAINCAIGQNHSASFGSRTPGDKLVFQNHIQRAWKKFEYTKVVVTYPSEGETGQNISYIELTDKYTNGHGACPKILEGGVGTNNVRIELKSGFYRGIDFVVKIYSI
uniref:Venom protein family 3 protein 1 n=1 Tax=Platymeris rhadamanthus TaxID=1134088 RepID=A0A6B9L3Q4_PLARH|nr:venom protein family 3 protein 1 [Platymeris rhadamanthus]